MMRNAQLHSMRATNPPRLRRPHAYEGDQHNGIGAELTAAASGASFDLRSRRAPSRNSDTATEQWLGANSVSSEIDEDDFRRGQLAGFFVGCFLFVVVHIFTL